jgi:hypothetical protein
MRKAGKAIMSVERRMGAEKARLLYHGLHILSDSE